MENQAKSSITNQFETGDILLFEHKNDYSSLSNIFFTFISKAIRLFTKSRYSHAAIIVNNPSFRDEKGLFILESSVEYFTDTENKQYKLGVQLVDYKKMIDNWNGNVYWRKLECKRGKEFDKKISEIHSTVHNRPYDLIPTDWIKAGFHIAIGNQQREKTFWCSALVSYVYTQLGFLPKDTKWSMISPEQLGTEPGNKDQLTFVNCTVHPEKIIK